MADTLKAEMMDSIGAGLSKPSSTAMAQAYCATVISNLEGWKCVALPYTKESREATIDRLDARVRNLENMGSINPPPPMDTPSWDSLMWRVARLHRKMPVGPPINRCAVPPFITPSLDLLRSTLSSIGGVGWQSWALFSDGGDLEADGLLELAGQYLCYLAGKRGFKVIGSFELKQNCKLALEMSLDMDANSGLHHRQGFPVSRQPLDLGGPPPPAGRMPLQKGCCGCCACACHKTKKLPHPGVLMWMTGKYHEEKRAKRNGVKARIARAFKKLAFWRRREYDTDSDDVSSIMTTSTVG
ncbi:hypothetical protein F5Y09DRAFT_195890 [Xylaria sp. FL1042]|nr:hypothetical protein F5Y09DRAFT_195890 [Xylaria sp. FL1042]